MDFTGRIALITGASTGIGRATAIRFAEQSISGLALLDMNLEGLEAVRSELSSFGIPVEIYQCDISDEAHVKEVCADVVARLGKVDILVNNAGLWRTSYPFAGSDSAEWRRKIDVNILGTMYMTHALIDGMIERGWGRIVNVASVAGVYGIANMADYSMTKGAIIAFTKALAKEVSEKGVLVNATSPGGVSDDPAACAPLAFMNRSGSYRENANLICFLSSEEASYISGQNYQIDGCRKKM